MKNLTYLLIFVLFAVVVSSEDLKISEAFTKSKISPDVVSHPPSKLLKIDYPHTNKEVKLGNELAPKDVREPPSIHYDADSKSFYTLVMSDPDAPSRKNPRNKEWNHWLVVNIPGSDISKGQVINEYVGSGPPKNSGLHRYVFLLYKQPEKIKFDEPHRTKTDGRRARFSTEEFSKKYKLGNPIEGNYFEAEFDDSVPALHKQLGF